MLKHRIIIRKAELKDVESITNFNINMAIETEGRELDKSVVLDGVRAVIEDPSKGFYLTAEKVNGTPRIVGQLLVTFEWSDWRNRYFWWIQSVYVHNNFRNRKIFSRLFSRLVEIAQDKRDVYSMRLYVEESNISAKQVYEALGMSKSSYEIYEIELDQIR